MPNSSNDSRSKKGGPPFLSFAQVEALHRVAIEAFGGTLGIRDRGALEAAIFHPQNVYFYGQGDLYELAAAYAYHIAESQAFLDGNKRTAISAAFTFLEGNGIATDVDPGVVYEAMIAIAEHRMTRSELVALFRRLLGR